MSNFQDNLIDLLNHFNFFFKEGTKDLAMAIGDLADAIRDHPGCCNHSESMSKSMKVELPDGTPLSSLDLSARPSKCLRSVGVKTVEELCGMTAKQILQIRAMGKVSLAEIETQLGYRGLSLRKPVAPSSRQLSPSSAHKELATVGD